MVAPAKIVALSGVLLLLVASPVAGFAVGSLPRLSYCAYRSGSCVAIMQAGKRGPVSKALQKPTGATTVSVEFKKGKSSKMSELESNTLSMQLRKFKTSAVWTADLDMLSLFSAEQKAAKGNFPGPVPLIFNGDSADLESAASAGAGGIVLRAGELDKAEAAGKYGMEVIWEVGSAEEAGAIVDAGLGDAFLLQEADAKELIAALPKVRICFICLL